MNRIINFIIISFLFSNPIYDFHLNKSQGSSWSMDFGYSNNQFPESNGIIDIESNTIILFMKGTKQMPMCGFSATVVNLLNSYDVQFADVNVLEDPEIRVNLSKYSNWPTIPQLFVNGTLIGGCDIAMELHNNGQLKKILDSAE